MKKEIVNKSLEMFLGYGFKTITMDEIATNLKISKKTLYEHFSNKAALVSTCVMNLNQLIEAEIRLIFAKNLNPIAEIYEITNYIDQVIYSGMNNMCLFQLQKYYPKIYSEVKKQHKVQFLKCITDNLKKGMELNLYRKKLDVKKITNLHYLTLLAIKENNEDAQNLISEKNLYLELYLRSIATDKGLKKIINILT